MDSNINLIRAFMLAPGPTEIPKRFLYWSAITMIAALLKRNVFMNPMGFDKIFPNIYTFLIGPGGVGKGQAMKLANVFVESARLKLGAQVNPYRGKVTFASLYDEMTVEEQVASKPVFLLTPELANSVGRGDMARQMISMLTDMYESHSYTPYTEGTRTHGKHTMLEPCITWMAATTEAGFRESVTPADFENGFIGRIVVVTSEYKDLRVRPNRENFDLYYDYIIKTARDISIDYIGEMFFDEEAQEKFDTWYETRPRAKFRSMDAGWHRLPVLVSKLAMIHHIAECNEESLATGAWHFVNKKAMERAIKDGEGLFPAATRFIENFLGAREHPKFYKVMEFIANRKECYEQELNTRFRINDLVEIIPELQKLELISRRIVEERGRDRIVVTWIGPKNFERALDRVRRMK